MKVYIETCVVSAIGKGEPAEAPALAWLRQRAEAGDVLVCTSAVTKREIDRIPARYRPPVEKVYDETEKVPFVEDHTLLGFHCHGDRTGSYAMPLVTDDPIARQLWALGLNRTDNDRRDVHHLMVAIRDGCDLFLTCDKAVLHRRGQIQALFPTIRVLRPSEMMSQWDVLPAAGRSPALLSPLPVPGDGPNM
jgi:hypothetical protein